MKAKLVLALVLTAVSQSFAATPTDTQAKSKAAVEKIKKMAADPSVVAAVKAQNAKKVTLATIKKIDAEWIAGDTKVSSEISSRSCSVALQKLLQANPELIEAFAMDDQGANVCMSDRTSDYWQGDEAKWQKSFAGGKGAVFTDERKFDSSAQAVVVQVSVPVNENGKVIGVLTVGVKDNSSAK
jgi:hypothetical protein